MNFIEINLNSDLHLIKINFLDYLLFSLILFIFNYFLILVLITQKLNNFHRYFI